MMNAEDRAAHEQTRAEFTDWLASHGLTPDTEPINAFTEASPFTVKNVSPEFPPVTAPGGLPAGWVLVDSFGLDFRVCQTPTAWTLVSDIPLTTGGRALRHVVTRLTLGLLMEAIFGSGGIPQSVRMQLTGLLGRAATPDDGWEGETMIAALGADPLIPRSAYSPDLTLP